MKSIKIIVIALFSLFILSCNSENKKQDKKAEEPKAKTERIVSLDGTLTEILVALGLENQIVAVDVTSMYPSRIKEKATQLGHTRGLNIEAILAQKPTRVFATEKGVPDKLKTQLEASKVPVSYYKAEKSVEGAKQLLKALAKDFKKEAIADSIIANIDRDMQGLKPINKKPKVMFVYARGAGTLLVAGQETPTAKMIELAGGENIATDYKDYKPLTSEAVIAANPDVLLFFTSGLQSLGGVDGLSKIPALTQTTAAKKKQVITMDGLFLTGFGPRLGKAIKKLNEELSAYAK